MEAVQGEQSSQVSFQNKTQLMPFLVQKWEHSIPQESGTLNPGFAQDRGSAPCPWGGVAVRTLLFCKALLLSLKPEKLCVGLAGVMDIQNSVRASKSATWKQGDELSLGMAECWPEQHLHPELWYPLPASAALWNSSRLLNSLHWFLLTSKTNQAFTYCMELLSLESTPIQLLTKLHIKKDSL